MTINIYNLFYILINKIKVKNIQLIKSKKSYERGKFVTKIINLAYLN